MFFGEGCILHAGGSPGRRHNRGEQQASVPKQITVSCWSKELAQVNACALLGLRCRQSNCRGCAAFAQDSHSCRAALHRS